MSVSMVTAHTPSLSQVDAMNEEWRHLFSEAGVTEAMLRDKATLQFILDTVYQIGGEPPKLTVGTSKCVLFVTSPQS